MAIGGAFLGGGVEVVPAGSCKLELEILTEDRANLTATFTIKGTSTYTVTAGADGRAVYTVPAGQTYTVSVNATGYDNIASQTVIAESGTVRYVRFEALEGRVKRSGDTMTGTLAVAGGASIDTNGQVIGKKLRSTADIHLGSPPSSYAVINDGWIQNRTLDETKADLGITGKQDRLTAGTNITISGTTISAKDTTYDVATQSANGLMSSTDKTKLDGVDSALAGKVSKSGDTMSGTLTVYGNPSGIINRSLIKQDEVVSGWTRVYQDEVIDSDGKTLGYSQRFRSVANDGSNYDKLSLGVYAKGGAKTSAIGVVCPENGEGYADAPSWSPGTNDNSDKILTIKMANSLPSLVHTTGNESIAGIKTFTANPIIKSNLTLTWKGPPTVENINENITKDFVGFTTVGSFLAKATNGEVGGTKVFRSTPGGYSASITNLIASNSGGTEATISLVALDTGVLYSLAPTTPSGAITNEIVTANWAYDKFQRKITYGTGDPPSGGQAGDIYIKI